MDQTGVVGMIDQALEQFAGRDLVASAEVLDFLLDLRTAAVADEEIEALLDAEQTPAAP